VQDLEGYEGPVILDIDLDAFECVDDDEYRVTLVDLNSRISRAAKFGMSLEECGSPELFLDRVVSFRKQIVFNLLSRLPRPGLITIARSQTPMLYTPAERIDSIQAGVLEDLRRLYDMSMSLNYLEAL